MKFIRNFLDRIEPQFSEGGKLQKLYPIYEMIDTFLYTPGEITKGQTHIRDALDLKRMMIMVVAALGPCILLAMYNTGLQANLAMTEMGVDTTAVEGWRHSILGMLGCGYDPTSIIDCFLHGAVYFIPIFIVCNAVGGGWEALFSIVRKHDINEGFLVTGMLFPLVLPPMIPLWQVALGISFGVVFGKEIFGGTGKNFLNPALTGRAFLYFAYPAQISGDAVWTAVDGFSGATPLTALATADPTVGMGVVESTVSWNEAFLGLTQGSMGETSTLACIFGAAVLIATGIGSWRIMAGVLAGSMGFAALLNGIGSDSNAVFAMSPAWHLVTGGLAFGLVFMATDPVSAAMTDKGKWIYGLLIGAMTILIRVINPAFPEGIMLAILFGNVFAPLIDYYVVQANIKRRLART